MSATFDPSIAGGNPKLPGPFANMIVGKRRRMRTVSGGNRMPDGTMPTPTAKPAEKKNKGRGGADKKGSCDPDKPQNQTIPIFLKKTYKMIDTCDPTIASWTEDGEMFVVKDPALFATKVIPQYFDHNKFSSFARQLNFYGFRKMQAKPIRNADFDADTAKYVTFYNEKFKRGRCDLLKEIQRSTRGGQSNVSMQDHQKEVDALKAEVAQLEQKMEYMNSNFEERMRTMELNMLGQMERMMIALGHQPLPSNATSAEQNNVSAQPQQQPRQQQPRQPSVEVQAPAPNNQAAVRQHQQQPWDPIPYAEMSQEHAAEALLQQAQQAQTSVPMTLSQSIGSVNSAGGGGGGPTLPPHPKQKQLSMSLPDNLKGGGNNAPHPGRFPSISIGRGLSTASGFSVGGRGLSTESSASAVLMRNSWEDKFFHALMLGDNEGAAAAQRAAGNAAIASGENGGNHIVGHGMSAAGPVSDEAMQAAIAAAQLAQVQNSMPAGIPTSNNMMGRQTTASMPLEAAELSPSSSSDSLND